MHPSAVNGKMLHKPIVIFKFGTTEAIKICQNASEVSLLTGIPRRAVIKYTKRLKRNRAKDYDFKYLEDLMGD